MNVLAVASVLGWVSPEADPKTRIWVKWFNMILEDMHTELGITHSADPSEYCLSWNNLKHIYLFAYI